MFDRKCHSLQKICKKSFLDSRIDVATGINVAHGTFGKDIKCTLESVIDVGQGISVGHGKFDKKNKRRALNTHVLCSK